MKNHLKVLLPLFICISIVHAFADNRRNGSRRPSTSHDVHVDAGWNLISVPLDVIDAAKGDLYPTAASPAFSYQDSYVAQETLQTGNGYWVKFSSPQTITINGDTALDKGIPLRTGWNMIGSLTDPVPASNIYTEPNGIISSKYFRYASAGGYQEADTIQPGLGYWVKSTQDGMLFLTAPDPDEGLISDSARQVILNSITTFVNGLPHVDDNADNLALLNYLRSFSEFEASDTLMGGVWGRFIDGRMFMRANDMPPGDSLVPPPFDILSTPREVEQVASPTDNLPTSSTAWICNAMGSFFENLPGGGVTQTVNQLRQFHQLAGYTLAPNAGASVGDLKTVSNVGVFYISGHGQGCYDRDSNLLYGVWTSDVQDSYYDVVFRRDLRDGNLVYFSAPDLDDGSEEGYERIHYAFTERFVQKYMKFQGGAAVFMNSCWSHYEPYFAQACLNKGAGFYVGWSRSVQGTRALRAARHFFDRILGTNKYYQENPPQRPFDADLVWNDLILKGYNTSPGGCYITIDPVIPRTNLLAPSILQSYPSFIPGESKFYIDGLFGQDARPNVTVKVGSTTLNIQDWDSTKLTLDQPMQGGNVQVTIRGIKSNVTQYTEWHGVFDYTLTGRGSLKQHIVMNVDFLADVHSPRLNIADPPVFPFARFVQVLNTSHATYECSGEYRNPEDTSIVEEYWTGAGSLPLGDISSTFWFQTVIGPPENPNFAQLGIQADFYINGVATPLTLIGEAENLTLTMNTSYVVGGGNVTGSSSLGSATMTWSDMSPIYPPDPTGAR